MRASRGSSVREGAALYALIAFAAAMARGRHAAARRALAAARRAGAERRAAEEGALVPRRPGGDPPRVRGGRARRGCFGRERGGARVADRLRPEARRARLKPGCARTRRRLFRAPEAGLRARPPAPVSARPLRRSARLPRTAPWRL